MKFQLHAIKTFALILEFFKQAGRLQMYLLKKTTEETSA